MYTLAPMTAASSNDAGATSTFFSGMSKRAPHRPQDPGELIAPTFLILLGGVTLAAAIAFGIGGQGVARQIVEDGYEKSEETKQQIQQQQRNQEQQNDTSSESVTGDGEKPGARRLRREY
jgi:uncharacterized protein HemX